MQGEKVEPDDDQSHKDQSDLFDLHSSYSVLSKSRSPEFESHTASLEHEKTSRRLKSQDGIKQRTVEQVVNMYAQHDFHAACRERIRSSRRRSIRYECKAKVHSEQAAQKTVEEQHEWDIFPVDTQRQMPTMHKEQNTKVVKPVKI